MSAANKEPESGRVRRLGRLGVVVACWLMLGGMALAARSESFVMGRYTDGVGQSITVTLSRITRPLPFSLAELLLVLGFALVAFLLGKALRAAFTRKRTWRSLLHRTGWAVLIAGHVLTVLFYALWGMNYAAPGLAARMHWALPVAGDASREEEVAYLAGLCAETVRLTNAAYREAYGDASPEEALAMEFPIAPIDRALERTYGRVANRLNLAQGFAIERGPAKPVRGSIALSYLGIAGIYSPFTGEANYNADVPRCSLPDVMAHEKAHQRGIADEGDASFVGFLACVMSDAPYARYSGYLSAQRDLLLALYPADPERVKALVAGRLPGVQRDVDAIRAFWTQFDGPARKLGKQVNDAYLKVNRVEGGVVSYDRVTFALIAFARENGDSLRLPPAARGSG